MGLFVVWFVVLVWFGFGGYCPNLTLEKQGLEFSPNHLDAVAERDQFTSVSKYVVCEESEQRSLLEDKEMVSKDLKLRHTYAIWSS